MKKEIRLFVVFVFVGVLMTGCTSYPKEVKKALEQSYGQTFNEYTFRGNPVGNFGVGTIYSSKVTSESVDLKKVEAIPSAWLLAHPDSWYESNVDDNERKYLNTVIFSKGSMGSVKLSENISTGLKLNVAIPNLSQILDVGAKLDYKKGVKVTITATDATNRQLNLSELRDAIKKNKIKSYVSTYLQSNKVVIGAQDIILSGYSAVIEVDINTNPELNAKLNEAVGKTLGKESKLSVNFKKRHEGTFIVNAVNPVVAAVLYLKPPTTTINKSLATTTINKSLATTTINKSLANNFDDWEVVSIKSYVLTPVEAILSK